MVREASFFATKEGSKKVERYHVKRALLARAEREGFIELRMREDISAQRIRIQTTGAVTGQINGLTVIDLGSYAFGMPVRITCKTGAGRGDIIDIERETELGGPIHTKGTMIMKGILLDRFGKNTPLCLQAILCMEQSYSEIDGDSASLAETCALFSSLASVPLRQDVAMTGSVDQAGNAQAVGGVNEKIEGFFRVCEARDPLGKHEVLIPWSNARDLMLDEEVVDACRAGRFTITTVDTVEDALEALTGVPWTSTKKIVGIYDRTLQALESLARVQAIANSRPPLPAKTPSKKLAQAAKPKRR